MREGEAVSSPSPPEQAPLARLRSLDGLRGAAAVIVLVHHTLLTIPVLAGAYYASGPDRASRPLAWAATYTPLHFVWAGSEAVDLFFLLSGVVLTLPALGRAPRWWASYYPRRLIRLYVPTIAAVAFGYLLVVMVPRANLAGLGAWLEDRPKQITGLGALKDLTLVDGVSYVTSTLWSLQWEVQFSLLLPVFVLIGLALRRFVVLEVALLGVAMLLGGIANDGRLLFLPIFAVGVAMAIDFDRLRALAARIDSHRFSRYIWVGITAAAVMLFTAYWPLQAFGDSRRIYAITRVMIVAGAAAFIFLAVFAGPLRRILENRVFQWLGMLSFSLYLVHEPIVIATGILAGPHLRWVAMVVGPLTAFATAMAFQRLIERPGHRWARSIGNATSACLRSRT